MTNAHNPIRLFETVADDCPYLDNEQSASILVDPDHEITEHLFSLLSRSGFRRSGEMLYLPKCPRCQACVSVRIPVSAFLRSKSQKRIWRKNQDLRIEVAPVSYQKEHFQLYLRYQQARHPDSSMCDDDPQKYLNFIDSAFSNSRFICMYINDTLIGISVIDQFDGGLSAVYTFFDPDHSSRSLGIYAILYLQEMAKIRNIPYVYLGYWVANSKKMSYKKSFTPLQGYINKEWITLNDDTSSASPNI